jgi:hypothetical protein
MKGSLFPISGLFTAQMSPDRGQELSPDAVHQLGRRKSKDSVDNVVGMSIMNASCTPEANIHRTWHTSTSHTALLDCRQSHDESRYKNDFTMDSQAPQKPAASIRSLSSTENSRRDSAISASSTHCRRPKTSRSMSKRSLQSVAGNDLTQTVSHSSRRRPRPQRFASSASFHAPHGNIEEALALHARSCELFASASRPTTSNTPTGVSSAPYHHPGLYRSLSSTDALPISQHESQQAIPLHAHAESSSLDVADEDKQYYSGSFPPTVLHWTSDETRAKEYAAIDRSNTGIRGLLRKMLPKCVRPDRSKFYDEKDGSDAGSVRRIRLDFPNEKNE